MTGSKAISLGIGQICIGTLSGAKNDDGDTGFGILFGNPRPKSRPSPQIQVKLLPQSTLASSWTRRST